MYSSLVIERLNDYGMQKRRERVYKFEKKTGCHYYEGHRFKNNEKNPVINLESFELVIDTNISPNFIVEEIDLNTGRTIQVHLKSIEQPTIGDSKANLSIIYINENQEFFETTGCFYFPVIKGTVAKKIQCVYPRYIAEAKKHIEKINSCGFNYGNWIRYQYFANYIYFRLKEMRAYDNIFSSFIENLPINIMLLLYSSKTANSLHTPGEIRELSDHFVHMKRMNWIPEKVLLTSEEYEVMEPIVQYYIKNHWKLMKLADKYKGNYYETSRAHRYFNEDCFMSEIDM